MNIETPKEIVAVMENVAGVTEMVYNGLIEAWSGTDFFDTFICKEGKTLEELEGVMESFMEANETKLGVVFSFVSDKKFARSYRDIGNKAVMTMGALREEILEGITIEEFGMSLVETNVYYAIQQRLNGFTEINFNAVHYLSQIEMQKNIEEQERHVEMSIKIIRKVLVQLEAEYKVDENLFSVMTSNQFAGFIATKINAEEVAEDYKVFSRIAESLIDVDTELGREVAELNMAMYRGKVERGEMHPLAILFDIDEVVGSFLDYLMTIILETFHHMVMDGKGAEEIDIRGVIELIDTREEE